LLAAAFPHQTLLEAELDRFMAVTARNPLRVHRLVRTIQRQDLAEHNIGLQKDEASFIDSDFGVRPRRAPPVKITEGPPKPVSATSGCRTDACMPATD
jgi:hypothetical protein